MKATRLVSVTLFALSMLGGVALPDEEGFKDIPFLSRMPNYGITAADDREFADFEFFDGKQLVRMEGKLWVREYVVKPDATAASDLQIRRN